MEIRLISPDGATVILVNGMGGSGDDFDETTFDDNASAGINSGNPPFQGVFRPIGSLGQFNGSSANGVWRLEVADRAFQDGGSLNTWELEIITDEVVDNTGPFLFHNREPIPILSTGVNTIESQINVQGLGDISVAMVCITIDLDHTFTGDLKISIVSPDNTEVVLVEREGGGGDNFRDTTFDDTASEAITAAFAPFTGSFRPEGNLSDFQGISPTDNWKLIVKDQINQDGGVLKSWTLAIKSDDTPQPATPFKIEVRFVGDPNSLSPSQKAVFQTAADRWSEIIVGNLPTINTDIGLVVIWSSMLKER